MFDLSNMHTRNVDNLHSWRVYRLARPMQTSDGRMLGEGSEVVFEEAWVNINTGAVKAHFNDAGTWELLEIPTQRKELEGFVWLEREAYGPAKPKGPAMRTPAPADPSCWAGWLAEHPDWEDAAKVMMGRGSCDSRADADTVYHAAWAFREIYPAVARWLAERSLQLYYAWTAQATSGGEGRAMQNEVRSHLDDLEAILKR